MTQEEMEIAARALIRQSQHEALQQHPAYYQHVGGFSGQELRDYNQYSPTSPADTAPSLHHRQRPLSQPRAAAPTSPTQTDSGDSRQDNLVQVTTTL